jgi:hypothetical protein
VTPDNIKMDPAASKSLRPETPSDLAWLSWKFVRDTRPIPRTLPDFTPDLDSEDLLEELLSDSEDLPVSDSAIELRRSDLAAGVFTLPLGLHRVLTEDDGCQPKTYVGSATDNNIASRKYYCTPFDHPFASANN